MADKSVTKRRDTRPWPWHSRSKAMTRDQIDKAQQSAAAPPPDNQCPAADRLTIYFDGSCPLCRLEIAHYAAQPGADCLAFIDVSAARPDTGPDLVPAAAMARFHVRLPSGRLVSGAEAFAQIWQRLPAWRLAARLASLPAGLAIMETMYRLFLPVRPFLSSFVGWMQEQRWRRRRHK